MLEAELHCSICGCIVDPNLEHSETCATAEATRRHYSGVRALVEGLKVEDPGVATAARELTSTVARPADVLTTLDACVASANAVAA